MTLDLVVSNDASTCEARVRECAARYLTKLIREANAFLDHAGIQDVEFLGALENKQNPQVFRIVVIYPREDRQEQMAIFSAVNKAINNADLAMRDEQIGPDLFWRAIHIDRQFEKPPASPHAPLSWQLRNFLRLVSSQIPRP